MAELVDQAGKGVVPARRKETFSTYGTQWMDTRARQVRDITANGYRSALNHAYAAFGATPLGEVTRRDVERMANKLTDAGRSQRHLSYVLFVVRSVFEEALHDGLISRNPAARVGAVGRPPKAREALSTGDMVKLRAHLEGDRLYACWLLTLYSLRRSEVLGERWPDVDLSVGEFSVDRGVVADSSGRRSEPTDPKTRRGRGPCRCPRTSRRHCGCCASTRRLSSDSTTPAPGTWPWTSWACRTGPNAARRCGKPLASSRSPARCAAHVGYRDAQGWRR